MTATAPYYPGYDRDCDPGGCVFGEEWTDDNNTRFGHNGCDTRQDVLLQQMHHIELRWSSECRIYQARMRDPYTGRKLTWRRDGYRIQVDHVYPLSRAWYAGAWAWTQQKRVRFANDVDPGARPRDRDRLGRDQPGQGELDALGVVAAAPGLPLSLRADVPRGGGALRPVGDRRRRRDHAGRGLSLLRPAGSQRGAEDLGHPREVPPHGGPFVLAERRVDVGQPRLHGLEQRVQSLAAGAGDLDLGPPAVGGVGSPPDVPACGQPVHHARGRR